MAETVAAAVAIVHARPPAESVLLIRRAERDGDPWSGHWSFPGGRSDPADRDALATALRELEEECGIRLARDSMAREMPVSLAGRRAGSRLHVAPFLFEVKGELPTVLDPREAVQALWAPLAILRDPAHHRLSPVPGMAPTLWFPGIEIDGLPLWGFTYRLIAEWLGLAPGDGQAGLLAARSVLEFLAAQGLPATGDFLNGPAAVQGGLPWEAVLARFSAPGPHLRGIGCLEANARRIRLYGPAFEEYVINGSE